MHGFLSRDGMPPAEFREIARAEVAAYESVRIEDVAVTGAACKGASFSITTADGRTFTSRKLLLATGVADLVPDVPGLKELYGRSVFHCPYCDGYEVRDTLLAVYGREDRAYGLALELTGWSRDIVIVSDGPSGLDMKSLARLEKLHIPVREEKIVRMEGRDGQLEQIVFESGSPIAPRALFFTTGQTQRSPLGEMLGCDFNAKGTVRTGPYESTHLKGLYVAGDASRAVQWVVVAAAEGAEAAFAINQELIKESLTQGSPT